MDPVQLLTAKNKFEEFVRKHSVLSKAIKKVGLSSEAILVFIYEKSDIDIPPTYDGCPIKVISLKEDPSGSSKNTTTISKTEITRAIYDGVITNLEDPAFLEIMYEVLFGEDISWDEEAEIFIVDKDDSDELESNDYSSVNGDLIGYIKERWD